MGLLPDMVGIFEVWQNAFAAVENDLSNRLLDVIAHWLREIEDRNADEMPPAQPSRWGELKGGLPPFKQALVRLIFRSASARPDLTRAYLEQLLAVQGRGRLEFDEIVDFSPLLAEKHADQLVALSLKQFLEELPADRDARLAAESERAGRRRRKALAKAPERRTREDTLVLTSGFSLSARSIGDWDWDRLAIRDDTNRYFPASPLKEPFHSLFAKAPNEALRLIRELCNHAATAWRQLHRLDYNRRGTPIPLRLTFPWGIQEFWGGNREYQRCRAHVGPKPLLCAFLALEDWALDQLEKERPADELIREIVSGNECIAVLGTAVAIALTSETVSETVFALVTSQRLLAADEQRAQQDLATQASLIGFMGPQDSKHVKAVQRINGHRRRPLSHLVPNFFLFAGSEMKARTTAAIRSFHENLPFAYEEARSNAEVRQAFLEQAEKYGELVEVANYRRVEYDEKPDKIAIVHVSPTETTPEKLARAEAAGRWLKRADLQRWADKFLESGKVDERWSIQAAIDFAMVLETHPIEDDRDYSSLMGPGTIAAVAAVALTISASSLRPDDRVWARRALRNAIRAPEYKDQFWSPSSVVPWHPGIYGARGLAAELRRCSADADLSGLLLELAAHPLECVSLASVTACFGLFDIEPRLAWAALHLALSLCAVPPRHQPASHSEPYHTEDVRRSAVEEANQTASSVGKWKPLPLPPDRWTPIENVEHPARVYDEDGDEEHKWVRNPIWWNERHASDIIDNVPVREILASEARSEFFDYIERQLEWTIRASSPPWANKSRRHSDASHRLHRWQASFGGFLGRAAGCFETTNSKDCILNPILLLDEDHCWNLLQPLTNFYICTHVFDADHLTSDRSDFLLTCLERILQDRSFKEETYRAGEFHGFDLPHLISELMFVQVDHAGGAKRFVNGDWSEIEAILPVVDRFVRAAGWSSTVMSKFLTLCERSKDHYPAETFADEILDVIGKEGRGLQDWHGTFLPARIAALVQHFAERETPMAQTLSQKLLKALDHLVDMGDRRSAALQLSELFREVQTTNW